MRRLFLLAFALVAACSDAPEADAPQPSRSSPTATSTASSEPTPAPASTPAPAPSASGSPDITVAAMNLRPGVYALAGSTCPPASAGLATFDGKGFGSRNAAQCTFVPTARDGATWRGTQTCTDPYSQDRISDALTITVSGPTRFTRSDKWGTASFDLCPDEDLVDWTR